MTAAKTTALTPIEVRVPRAEYWDHRHAWQIQATRALDVDHKRGVDVKIHRGGRKTTWAVNTLIRDCCRYRQRSYAYIAPTLVQATGIVWREPTMLFRWLPDRAQIPWVANKAEHTITFPTGCVLGVLGADKPDSIRGFNPYGMIVDEWAECKRELWTDILAPILARSPDRWIALTYTSQGNGTYAHELTELTRDDPEWLHMVVSAEMSGLIAEGELAMLRRTIPAAVYAREMLCVDTSDEEMTLITSAMVERLDHESMAADGPCPAIISCDPALGGNECSMDVHRGKQILESQYLRTDSVNEIMGALMVLSTHHHIYDFIVDENGLGHAIVTGLENDTRYRVQRFNGSAVCADRHLRNRRAEAFWYVREEMQRQACPWPQDAETRRQLPLATRFFLRHGRIQIHEKCELRKVIGRSPDRAESFVMARWGLQFARPTTASGIEFQEMLISIPSSDPRRPPDYLRRNRWHQDRFRRGPAGLRRR